MKPTKPKSKKPFKVNVKNALKVASESAINEKEIKEKRERDRSKSRDKSEKPGNQKFKKKERKQFDRRIVRVEGGVFSGDIKSSRFSRGAIASSSGGGAYGSFGGTSYNFRSNQDGDIPRTRGSSGSQGMFANKSGGSAGSTIYSRGKQEFTQKYDKNDELIRSRLNEDELEEEEDANAIYEELVGGTEDFVVSDRMEDQDQDRDRDGQVEPIKFSDNDILTYLDTMANNVIKWRTNDELCLIQMPYKLPINLIEDINTGVGKQANCGNFPYGRFGTLKIYKNKKTGEEVCKFEICAIAVAATTETGEEGQGTSLDVKVRETNKNNDNGNGNTENTEKLSKKSNEPLVKFNVSATNNSAICQEIFTIQNYDKNDRSVISTQNLKNFKEDSINREITILGNCKTKVIFSPVIS